MSSKYSLAILAAAALLIACILAACSSDDQQQQQQSSPAPAAAADQSQDSQDAASDQPAASAPSARSQRSQPDDAEQQSESQVEQSNQSDQSDDPDPAPAQQQEQEADEESEQAEQPAQEESQSEQQQEQAEPQAQAQAQDAQQAEAEEAGNDEPEQAAEQEREQEEQAEPEPDPEPTAEERLAARAARIAAAGTAPELTGLTRWLSGGPTTIARELAKGNVVLIDFWTYTCINCIRTFPFLVEWHDKYAEHGLSIIGVHSPEFEFEKEARNVLASMEQHGIEYFVAQDNDFRTWRAFSNRYWPAKYLIGPSMDVRYAHFGEGDYAETEHEIREALEEAGRDLRSVPVGISASVPTRDPEATAQTRELYGGTHRNYGRVQYAAQPDYYIEAGVERFYTDIPANQNRVGNKWYLQGFWRNEEEAIVHARRTENLEDYIALNFTARTVNVVLNLPPGDDPYRVYVEVDGAPVTHQWAGDDVAFDNDGNGYVTVTKDDLYRLVKLPEWSRHELKLRSDSDKFAVFAFTFGSYLGGE